MSWFDAVSGFGRRVFGGGAAAAKGLPAQEPPRPPMGEVVKGRFGNVAQGPYHALLGNAEWLGPYTPQHVPLPVLKLMREDPQLALGLAAYRGPFFGIDYDIEGANPEIRAFLRRTFLDTPLFHRVLESSLNALDYGFAPHETIWDLEDVTFDPDGPGGLPAHTMPLATVIREVNDIDPARVQVIVDEWDNFLGYRVDGMQLEVPASKTIHAVHAMEHRNWRGRALLKRGYQPWWWCNFIHLYWCRYLERKADPPYWGQAPAEPRPDPKLPEGPNNKVYPTEVLREQLMALKSSGVLVTPFELDPTTKLPMWAVKELTDGGRGETFLTAIQYMQALKLRSVSVPEEIATGSGSVGSYAKSKVVLDVFLEALETEKDTLVLRTINRDVIDPLVTFNFGRSAPKARVTAPEFNREQKELLGQLLIAALEIPQELDDGRVFTGAQMLNLERVMGLLNIPYRRAAEIARKKKAELAGGGAPPEKPKDGQGQPKDETAKQAA